MNCVSLRCRGRVFLRVSSSNTDGPSPCVAASVVHVRTCENLFLTAFFKTQCCADQTQCVQLREKPNTVTSSLSWFVGWSVRDEVGATRRLRLTQLPENGVHAHPCCRKALTGCAVAERRKCLCVQLGATQSLLFRAPVYCGCPAGTLQCDIVSKVTRYQSASPCWCNWSFSFGWVLWSGQVESSNVVSSAISRGNGTLRPEWLLPKPPPIHAKQNQRKKKQKHGKQRNTTDLWRGRPGRFRPGQDGL